MQDLYMNVKSNILKVRTWGLSTILLPKKKKKNWSDLYHNVATVSGSHFLEKRKRQILKKSSKRETPEKTKFWKIRITTQLETFFEN